MIILINVDNKQWLQTAIDCYFYATLPNERQRGLLTERGIRNREQATLTQEQVAGRPTRLS